MNNKITFSPNYKGLPINTCKARKYGAYTGILKAEHDQLFALLSYHSRVNILVFQLHVPNANFSHPHTWNQVVSEFLRRVKSTLSRKVWGAHKRTIHCWVREIGKTDKEHYHCYIGFKQHYRRIGAISADGYTGLWALMEKHWKELTGGFLRPSNAHTVNRGNSSELSAAFHHISYFAKVRDKDFGTGETHKRFSASRLRPKVFNCNKPLD